MPVFRKTVRNTQTSGSSGPSAAEQLKRRKAQQERKRDNQRVTTETPPVPGRITNPPGAIVNLTGANNAVGINQAAYQPTAADGVLGGQFGMNPGGPKVLSSPVAIGNPPPTPFRPTSGISGTTGRSGISGNAGVAGWPGVSGSVGSIGISGNTGMDPEFGNIGTRTPPRFSNTPVKWSGKTGFFMQPPDSGPGPGQSGYNPSGNPGGWMLMRNKKGQLVWKLNRNRGQVAYKAQQSYQAQQAGNRQDYQDLTYGDSVATQVMNWRVATG